MKVDLALGSPDPRDVAALAFAAEEMGFDGIWVAETRHDPFLLLALMAAATQRVELGSAVAIAFARSPTVIAHAAWDLAALSGGRFNLGLGTQVREHVERRFGMPWSAPAPRLEEWIGAMRAVWRTWQTGESFRLRSEHFDLSLMPEFFCPRPLAGEFPPETPPIPISIAGVGPGLARLAGRVADGFQVHPFHTARYLAEIIEPAIAEGESARAAAATDACRPCRRIVPVFLISAEDQEIREGVRRQVAFYAATPTYRRVLELHGRAGIGERLSRLAATGRWDEMPRLIDDELLALVAVVAPSARLAAALAARCSGAADRVMPLLPFELDPGGDVSNADTWREIIQTLRVA